MSKNNLMMSNWFNGAKNVKSTMTRVSYQLESLFVRHRLMSSQMCLMCLQDICPLLAHVLSHTKRCAGSRLRNKLNFLRFLVALRDCGRLLHETTPHSNLVSARLSNLNISRQFHLKQIGMYSRVLLKL